MLVPEFMASQIMGNGTSVGDFDEGNTARREDGADGFEKFQWAGNMLKCVATNHGTGGAVAIQDRGGRGFVPVLDDNLVALGEGEFRTLNGWLDSKNPRKTSSSQAGKEAPIIRTDFDNKV